MRSHQVPSARTAAHRREDTNGAGADSEALLAAVAELSVFASTEFDVTDILARLCDVAARALHVDGAGVMEFRDGQVRFVRASHATLGPVEGLRETLQTGPCRTSIQTSAIAAAVSPADIASRWPDFVPVADRFGIQAMVAVPLMSRGTCWGTLDLFWIQPHTCNDAELAAARLLANLAVSYLVMATDRIRYEAAQRQLANRVLHDQLTGLPNRGLIHELIYHALAAAERHGTAVAVVFVDLDGFKSVNDTYGHLVGDIVLQEAARRLRQCVRASDSVGRLSGDEFLVLCEELPTSTYEVDAVISKLADRINLAIAEPITTDSVTVSITASVGIAVTRDRPSAADLIHEADTAMYEAKARHPGGYVVRNSITEADLAGRRSLERRIFEALDRGEFRVFYQPILDRAGRVFAVEALLRWAHPVDGILPAAAFIDIAEATGVIVPIGHWVIRQVLADLEQWRTDDPAAAPEMVLCNLSPRELIAPDLPDVITQALARHHLTPADLGVEILETHLATPRLFDAVRRLQTEGHPLAIDDFGTGHSSLARLIDIPVSYLKIDRSLVAGLPDDPRAQRLLRAVMTIAADLDVAVISEGIETQAQADYLDHAGSHLFQGYHLGRPAPADHTNPPGFSCPGSTPPICGVAPGTTSASST